jgi:hypothetical protein
MPPPTAVMAAVNGAATQVTIVTEGWDRAKTIFSDRPPRQDCRWHRSRFSPLSFALAAGSRRGQPGSAQRRQAAAPPGRKVRRWLSVPYWATATAPARSAFPARRYARSRQARRRRRQGLTPQRRPANDCAPKTAPQRFRERPTIADRIAAATFWRRYLAGRL